MSCTKAQEAPQVHTIAQQHFLLLLSLSPDSCEQFFGSSTHSESRTVSWGCKKGPLQCMHT